MNTIEQIYQNAFNNELQKIATEAGHELKPGSFSKHVKKEPASSAKPGEGGRFKAMEHKLEHKGVRDPGALAASIGRAKYGKGKFKHMAAKGK